MVLMKQKHCGDRLRMGRASVKGDSSLCAGEAWAQGPSCHIQEEDFCLFSGTGCNSLATGICRELSVPVLVDFTLVQDVRSRISEHLSSNSLIQEHQIGFFSKKGTKGFTFPLEMLINQ